MSSMIYVLIIAVMIVWIFRNNKKDKQNAEKLQDSIKPGMYVMMRDGLYGTVVDVNGNDIVINVSVDGADEGCITALKSNVYTIIDGLPGENIKASGTALSIEERVNRAAGLDAAGEMPPSEASGQSPAENAEQAPGKPEINDAEPAADAAKAISTSDGVAETDSKEEN